MPGALGVSIGEQKIIKSALAPFPDVSNVQNMQEILPAGAKSDMTTFDSVLVKASSEFMNKAKKETATVFVWQQRDAHARVRPSCRRSTALMGSVTNYGLEEAGMAQSDDDIGALLKHLEDISEANDAIVSSPPTTAPRCSPGPTAA